MEPIETKYSEDERLKVLNSYQIIDTEPESDYDNINMLIAMICDVPVSLISIMGDDKFYFKSKLGVYSKDYAREISFCNTTVQQQDLLIINDARKDKRFKNSRLVTHNKIVFYAGIPLTNKDGYILGTICVYDYKVRELDNQQKEAIRILSTQVVNLFELRKKNINHKRVENELQKRNEQLNDFAGHVSHDLKSPLANITSLTALLRADDLNSLSEESKVYLDYIEESTTVLKDYIDGILMYYKSDELLKNQNQDVSVEELADDIEYILITKEDKLKYPKDVIIKNINKPAIYQILINLVDNALKYNTSKERVVEIKYNSDLFFHKFSVSDNGIGIPKDKQDVIFKIFKTLKSHNGKSSTGIGLSTVKSLVEKLGGTISLKSEKGKGSTFTFTIAK
ncbi:GAF domain-containing sensor histidine kinase [Sediminibacter sp. Hel_I_10]|uniref:GAF domain-containing sensor histidine kinase n=1 Tax=Sediminibacter sp. Hel_I_10 TaxID=1392490 RepID=UPI0004788769|nr:GAF domain-containing sensor histidine kinase [Sediminibacter sp. Hel_I_10]